MQDQEQDPSTHEPLPPDRRQMLFATGAFAALGALRPQAEDAPQADEEAGAAEAAGAEKAEFLFVQTARYAVLEEGTLTLRQVSPTTIYFSDRPERIAGHVETQHMVEAMLEDEDPNSFSDNPPNATLSLLDGEFVESVVVKLGRPKLNVDELTFPVEVLDGAEALKGGPVSLFIDPIGRPASPGSVAGVHRRTRRRTRRRVAHHRY
jgi:hypothetical protein